MISGNFSMCIFIVHIYFCSIIYIFISFDAYVCMCLWHGVCACKSGGGKGEKGEGEGGGWIKEERGFRGVYG